MNKKVFYQKNDYFCAPHFCVCETHIFSKMRKSNTKFIESLSDREIVEAILRKDSAITYYYMYEKCFPLFSSKFKNYYTDCKDCIEFINDIYVYIMTPRNNGKCYLAGFGFKCRFEHWLKIITESYCHQLYSRRKNVIEFFDENDRLPDISVTIDIESLNKSDVETILNMMSNQRYRDLIRYRYVEQKTNEETAKLLNMSMDNYYNKHRLAKEQFNNVLEKEGLL